MRGSEPPGRATPMTRRGALAAAAALALARPAGARAAQSHAERTARALRALIAAEQAAAFAYLEAGDPRLAAQEEQHAKALRPHLESVGLAPLPPPRGPADLDPAAARLAAASRPSARDAAAIALEERLIAAYAGALDALYDPSTVRTAATIMASHGQHLVVRRRDPLSTLD
jgi:hypothetical protein